MNEEILTAFKSVKKIKISTNEALRQLNGEMDRRIAEEEAIDNQRKTEINQKNYENTIQLAKNNGHYIIKLIIKDLVEKYLEVGNRYSDNLDSNLEISSLYFLNVGSYTQIKDCKYPYHQREIDEARSKYNNQEQDESKKMHYFFLNYNRIDMDYYKFSCGWEPVIFDIEKIKSFNLFSNFKLGKENLDVSAKYSTIKELISKAANEELEGIYDQELINYLKEVDQRIKYEKSIVESFSKHINTNTEIIYHYIYKRLIQNISNNETKRKHTISLRNIILNDSKDYEKILIYIKQSDPKYNDIVYCLYRDYMNNERKYLLISKSLLRSMLEQDKEYGYLNMEYKTNLNIKFDGIVFASKIAEMQEEKDQSLKLQIKD